MGYGGLVFFAVVLGIAVPGPAAAQEVADSVVGMCLERGREQAVCDCAAEALLGEIGAEDYATYEAVGADFLVRLSGGQSMVPAWDGAVAAHSESTGIGRSSIFAVTNPAGRAHAGAMRDCGG